MGANSVPALVVPVAPACGGGSEGCSVRRRARESPSRLQIPRGCVARDWELAEQDNPHVAGDTTVVNIDLPTCISITEDGLTGGAKLNGVDPEASVD